jgi:hypothetical protein
MCAGCPMLALIESGEAPPGFYPAPSSASPFRVLPMMHSALERTTLEYNIATFVYSDRQQQEQTVDFIEQDPLAA